MATRIIVVIILGEMLMASGTRELVPGFALPVLMLAPRGIVGRVFKLGLMGPRRHIRLGWDTNAAAASMAVERVERDGLLPGHHLQ